jgi:membrane protease YdiL (CAAX protease family)
MDDVLPYVQALLVYAIYSVGYPWFAARVPPMRGRFVFVEAASLVLVGIGVALLDFRGLPAGFFSGARDRWTRGVPTALQVLGLLGLIALALRVADPGFDDLEFSDRGLDTPAALVGMLALLPFGVAAEELVFRTCQKRLRRVLSASTTCAGVALAFALFHWVPGTPLDRHLIETLLATFAGGLAFAVAYEKTASLPLLVAVHLAYDILAVTQGWLNVRHEGVLEAALFLIWIGGGGALAFSFRRRAVHRSGGEPERRRVSALAWIAALGFGGVFPLILAWMRLWLRV